MEVYIPDRFSYECGPRAAVLEWLVTRFKMSAEIIVKVSRKRLPLTETFKSRNTSSQG